MPKADNSTAETLFHHWRRGDAAAGKAMAQRFTDWYYAISVIRMGEVAGDPPFRAACSKFSKGVVKVEDPRRLLAWAHGIARKQLGAAADTGRLGDGDLPSVFTKRRPPKELLLEARAHVGQAMALLEPVYRGQTTDADPLAVLRARYQLKAWLRVHMDVPFKITPGDPDPDRAPLVWYEASQLGAESDESLFELYMLNEPDLCQDIAEFAHYAIALRGGLPAATGVSRPTPNQTKASDLVPEGPPTASPATAAPQQAAPRATSSNVPFVLAGLLLLAVVLGALWFAVQWRSDDG